MCNKFKVLVLLADKVFVIRQQFQTGNGVDMSITESGTIPIILSDPSSIGKGGVKVKRVAV